MRLPPLNALRAFEAAARHESFSRAASELHVTQGAVSRHVKLLEDHLGVALFRRLPRGLALTDAGRGLQPAVGQAFQRIAEAARKTAAGTRDLDVICAPSFAIRWLIPRLAGFQERQPEIRVRLTTDCSLIGDFYAGDYDLAIDTYESIPETAFDVLPIRAEQLTPVCAPALLERGPPLARPEDLAGHSLLHASPDCIDWRRWLAAAGLTQLDLTQGQVFTSMDMAVRAAIAGQGVAVGDLDLIGEELAAGQLVQPFELIVREKTGYFLICAPGRQTEPKIAAFRDWLIAEFSAGG